MKSKHILTQNKANSMIKFEYVLVNQICLQNQKRHQKMMSQINLPFTDDERVMKFLSCLWSGELQSPIIHTDVVNNSLQLTVLERKSN